MEITRRRFLRGMSFVTAAAAASRGVVAHDMHAAEAGGGDLLDTNRLAR